MDKTETLLIGLEMELEINRQLFEEKHITYDIYQKVNGMILNDIERRQRELESRSGECGAV